MANYNEDYYKQLKDENYKTLLQSEIQLDNARQRAMKNNNMQLASQGMASAGYGSTARTGLENQYLTGLQNAQSQYQNQNANIEQQANEAKIADQNDKFNSLTSLMTSATNNDQLNGILQAQGYGNVGADGKFVWNQDVLNNLGQDSALQLQSIYSLYNSQNAEKATAEAENTFTTNLANLANGTFANKEELDKYVDAYFDTANMTESQKKRFELEYNNIANNLSGTYQNDYTWTGNNGINAEYINGYSDGSKFTLKNGDISTDLEIGDDAKNQDVLQARFADKAVGEVFLGDIGNGKYCLYVKSNDGKIKEVEHTGGTQEARSNRVANLLKMLGYNAEVKYHSSGVGSYGYDIYVDGKKIDFDKYGTIELSL